MAITDFDQKGTLIDNAHCKASTISTRYYMWSFWFFAVKKKRGCLLCYQNSNFSVCGGSMANAHDLYKKTQIYIVVQCCHGHFWLLLSVYKIWAKKFFFLLYLFLSYFFFLLVSDTQLAFVYLFFTCSTK